MNLGEAAEFIFDHTIYQDNLLFVDYCEQMVRETNPSWLERAETTEAPNANIHGFHTIADLMRSLNPFTGAIYVEALQMSRITREMFCLMEGRHVHPSTIYPGGVGTVPTPQLFTDYLVRLMRCMDWVKKIVPITDDLFDFFYDITDGEYAKVGHRRILLGCWGAFQNPDVVNYTYRRHERLGQRLVRDARDRGGRRAGHDEPGGHKPGSSHPARPLLLRRLGAGGALRLPRPAGQPGGPAAPVEPDHPAQAPEAGLRRQLQLGDEPALAGRAHRGPPRARYRRRGAGQAVGHGARRARGHRLRQGHG